MSPEISTLQYYIGQALSGLLARDGSEKLPSDHIAKRAVEIGKAVQKAEAESYRQASDKAADEAIG